MPIFAAPPSDPVTVTNTPLSVTVTNPSSGNVTITNPATNPVQTTIVNAADIAKAQGIQHPFQANVICGNSSSNGSATFCDGSFAMPAKQRVVIEYVALECGIDTGEGLRRALVNTVTTTLAEQGGVGSAGQHSLNIVDHSGVAGFVAIGQLVRFYADPGTTVAVEAQETGSHVGTFECTFDFVGQAIDTP
jgi:hypothetical protein